MVIEKTTKDVKNWVAKNEGIINTIYYASTAVSAKTMDTLRSKTYQNPKGITRTLNKYVDAMVNFTGDGKGKKVITLEDITSRQMYLAIPAQTTKSQWVGIKKSIDYANKQGVTIIIKEIK